MSVPCSAGTPPMSALFGPAPSLVRPGIAVHNRPVLLVDGDPDARTIMRRLLEFHGYEALEAVDHEGALSLAREQDVGLIVCEMFVTCGDGMTCLVESLRADQTLANIPVLVVTTQAFHTAEQRARRAGSAGYIVKPFTATDILAEVARLVS